jgi:hypothetical protein
MHSGIFNKDSITYIVYSMSYIADKKNLKIYMRYTNNDIRLFNHDMRYVNDAIRLTPLPITAFINFY